MGSNELAYWVQVVGRRPPVATVKILVIVSDSLIRLLCKGIPTTGQLIKATHFSLYRRLWKP